MRKTEHIGIAVKSLNASIPLFETLFKTPCYKVEEVAAENVRTAFFKVGDLKFELLESTVADGPIGRYIANKGEGVHHIAFEVENIASEMKRLSEAGFALLSNTPKVGADDKLICIFRPQSTNGVLIELCQTMKQATSLT